MVKYQILKLNLNSLHHFKTIEQIVAYTVYKNFTI